MIRFLRKSLFIVIPFLLLVTLSCRRDPKGNEGIRFKVEVKVEMPEKTHAKSLSLEVLDVRTLKKQTHTFAQDQLSIELQLEAGSYNLSISGESEAGRSLIGKKDALVVEQNMSLSIPLQLGELPVEEEEHLIFGDIFFNGEYNGRMMHPDQYFMVVNNGEKVAYLDGLCYAICAHNNSGFNDPLTKYMEEKGEVAITTLFQFPGEGKQYPLEPGKFVIVAETAINHHTEEQPNSADLSGADFEVVCPDSEIRFPNGSVMKVTDTDNPDVPNMKVVLDAFQGTGLAFPMGFFPPFLFRVDTSLEEFLPAHTMQVKGRDGSLNTYYTIPIENIVDGVETGRLGGWYTRSLPLTVDQGNFFVTSCHQQELAHRKTIEKDGRTYWLDTNNSTADYKMIKGQKSYPKKNKAIR